MVYFIFVYPAYKYKVYPVTWYTLYLYTLYTMYEISKINSFSTPLPQHPSINQQTSSGGPSRVGESAWAGGGGGGGWAGGGGDCMQRRRRLTFHFGLGLREQQASPPGPPAGVHHGPQELPAAQLHRLHLGPHLARHAQERAQHHRHDQRATHDDSALGTVEFSLACGAQRLSLSVSLRLSPSLSVSVGSSGRLSSAAVGLISSAECV